MGMWGLALRRQLPSLLCLTSMKGVQRTWTASLALAPSPLAATSAPPAPWIRPQSACTLGRDWWASARPPWGPREAEAARQERPGTQGSLGLLPRLCGLHCVFLTGPVGPAVWTCLSTLLSV